jgi:hypothetical protein
MEERRLKHYAIKTYGRDIKHKAMKMYGKKKIKHYAMKMNGRCDLITRP